MATLSALIRKNKVNKEGIAVVQIAVRHHQKTAYIPTDIKVVAKDFIGGMLVKGSKVNATNALIIAELNKYNERLEKIESVDAKSVTQIKDELSYDRIMPYHKISEAYKAFVGTLKSKSSSESYNTSLLCFLDFTKQNDINIEAIDTRYINKYVDFLNNYERKRVRKRESTGARKRMEEYYNLNQKVKYSKSTINTYLSHLKAVINWCISEEWVSYRVHPFSKTTITSSKPRENIITALDMQKIKAYKPTKKRYIFCHDIFMLSFYLGGLNFVDIARLNYKGDTITFERQKITSRTNGGATVTLPIIPEAREIINKYIQEDGTLGMEEELTANCTSNFNYCIKCIGMELKIKSYLTFTSARKCVAQIGTDLGINDNYLNYILGHSMSKARGMMHPYSRIESKMAGEFLKLIVSMVDTPERIEEIFEENLKRMMNFNQN